MKTTSEYIYETLFINGENSDISIDAMGKKYNVVFVGFCMLLIGNGNYLSVSEK